MDRVQLSVPGIRCEGCAESIEGALTNATGVERVEIDVEARRVAVEYDGTQASPDALRGHIKNAGFDSEVI